MLPFALPIQNDDRVLQVRDADLIQRNATLIDMILKLDPRHSLANYVILNVVHCFLGR